MEKACIYDLTCEYLNQPLGIDNPKPLLGFKLKCTDQKSYRILVSDSFDKLSGGEYNFWDSGFIESENCVAIPYGGKKLHGCKKYFWFAEIQTIIGEIIKSPISYWETGIMNESEWIADWIDMGEHYIDNNSILFSKTFKIKKTVKFARAYIGAGGYYELYLAGIKVGKSLLDTAQTDYMERVFYSTYDIKSFLSGDTEIRVLLGDGWYHQNLVWKDIGIYGNPCFILQIHITYDDGTEDIVKSDKSWFCTYGEITFNNIYAGEICDARIAESLKNNFESIKKFPVSAASGPEGKMQSQIIPPIMEMRTFPPVSIKQKQNGVYIVDAGKNMAGYLRMKVTSPKGSEITLRYAEELDKNGNLSFDSCGTHHTKVIQTDTYICSGAGEETYSPRFTYHGFRYVEISGYQSKLCSDKVTVVEIYTALNKSGSFSCSNQRLNDIHTLALNTFTSNIHGFPTDCPVRERCGWLGDAAVITESVIYNFQSCNFWKKYLEDIRTSSKLYGGVTMIAPGRRTYGAVPAWGMAQVTLPYDIYTYYGDKSVLSDYYNEMKLWIDSLTRKGDNSILYDGLSDFFPPGIVQRKEEIPAISTLSYLICIKRLAEISVIIEKCSEAKEYEALFKKVKNIFNDKFYNGNTKTYAMQSVNAIALYEGIVPSGQEYAVAENLAAGIKNKNYVIDIGHFGLKYLFVVLTEYRYYDVVMKLLNNDKYPSLGYCMKNGATTTWEAWEGSLISPHSYKDLQSMTPRSLNHPFKSSYDWWFYGWVLGIRPQKSAFSEISIKPAVLYNGFCAEGEYETPYGKVYVSFSDENQSFTLKVKIPENVKASIFVPYFSESNAAEQGYKWLKCENGYGVVEASCGEHSFTVKH